MRRKDFVSGVLLMVVAAVFSAASLRLPWRESGYGWFGSPGLVPLLLAVLLFCTGARLAYRSRKDEAFYRRMEERTESFPPPGEDETDAPAETGRPAWMEKESLRALLTVALCAGYILSLGRIPYMVATGIFIAAFIFAFRGGSYVRSCLIGAAASVSIWFVFYKIFAVFLP